MVVGLCFFVKKVYISSAVWPCRYSNLPSSRNASDEGVSCPESRDGTWV